MSVQIAELAPATRVASRKLGPDPAQRLALAQQPLGGLGHQHVGQHVRQVADRRQQAVVGLGVDRHRPRAEVARPAGGGARRARPRSARAGVRYQAAPSKRSARACSTPAVSAPAIGWPPTKRSSSIDATMRALGRADVGDHAVLGRRRERGGDQLRQRADGRADEADLGAVERLRERAGGAVDRPALARALQHAPGCGRTRPPRRRPRARGRRARSSRRSARRRGSRSASARCAARRTARGEPVQHRRRSCPSPCRRR